MAYVKKLAIIISIISFLCLADAIIISIDKSSPNSQQSFCSIVDKNSSCTDVQNSQYGKILGIDASIYGIVGFSLLLILSMISAIMHHRLAILFTSIGGTVAGIIALWFIYVQSVILKAFCSLCMIVDLLSIVLLVPSIMLLIVLMNRKHNF